MGNNYTFFKHQIGTDAANNQQSNGIVTNP